jgi:hypothetical protein
MSGMTRRGFLRLASVALPAGAAIGAAAFDVTAPAPHDIDIDIEHFTSVPLEYEIDRRAVANELADNIRIIAHEMGNDPMDVVRGLQIDPKAFAADLGCAVDDLLARLTVAA